MAAADYTKVQRVTFTSLISALCVAIMFISRIVPIGIYAIPPICSLFIMVVLIEFGPKWSIGCYLVSAVLSALFANPESSMVYIAFFGYYPILKMLLERINNSILKWIIKILFFNTVIVAGYFILNLFVPVIEEFFAQGNLIFIFTVIAAEIMFVLYDICIAKLSVTYIQKYHRIIRKALKKQ
ncbi:MAG: hypothetical protein UHN02_07680 [Acutalibacteraceae bacterium]|nr:hypothetical protein [Acutalibacteraceae bacterium]